MDFDLLKKLTQTSGISGWENRVREIMDRQFQTLGAEVSRDRLGNVIAHLPGKGPKMALAAHMDEVGLLVSKIEPEGFLRVIPVGDLDWRACLSQTVIVHGREDLPGVVGSTPPGFSRPDPKGDKKAAWESCFVDLGLAPAEVEAKIKLGDPITFTPSWFENQRSIYAKALDDRAGLFVMIEAVKAAHKINCDLHLIATVQEEIGLRGVGPAVFGISPDIFIALEGTFSPDTPGLKLPANISPTRVGLGPEIRISDRVMLSDRQLADWLSALAGEAGLPCQTAVKNFGNTDASQAQVTSGGSRALALSVPVRYLHCPIGLVDKGDLKSTVELTALALQQADQFSV
ncbi:MAG: M42 family peptidase [Deltaproteobacteria bacterium]|nr:M42 family peptidase [Deltaproteobacteria bacterium]